MNTSNYLVQEQPQTSNNPVKKSGKISFSSFQKMILANSEMRKQVKDVIDLALFDYAFQHNMEAIEAMRESADAESIQLMMQVLHSVADYQSLSKKIHRNWVIKTLAAHDKRDHAELIKKFTGR